jgi:divalent metal cation (Fe/Co/Zn/Cd) transporter
LRAPSFDAVASIVIGAILLLEAGLLGGETRGLITGEAVRPILLDRIREVVAHHRDIGTVDEIRTLQLGPDAVLLLLGVRAARTSSIEELETSSSELTSELRRVSPTIQHVAFYTTADVRRNPESAAFTNVFHHDCAMVSKLADELCVFLLTRFPIPVVEAQTGAENARPG